MAKNIILCSDGTGNKGGYGADTNVFKIYNAIDINGSEKKQITYYDDGVGTDTNKYIRALTGAFGAGFGKNVRDLYTFLARNYDPGDEIYMFGFSRGAATVRAFAGMIQECGLLNVDEDFCRTENSSGEKNFGENKFQDLVEDAFDFYSKIKSDPEKAKVFKEEYGVSVQGTGLTTEKDIPIKFIGVWDTVSALGFPQDWSKAFDWIFTVFDKVSDCFMPHTFYNYQLNENVENVYHAIAIDDERKTFHPKVWTETRPDRPQNIEQAWFAGVHSNVGGGYPRVGMSVVTLDWMVKKAQAYDLEFKDDVDKKAEADANVYGKLYDSRDGTAIYYRYSPRNIEELCDGRLKGPIKIHQTVFDRMKARTLGYAPGNIPGEFQVVETRGPDGEEPTEKDPISWNFGRSGIDRWIRARVYLYRLFVEATLVLVVLSYDFWTSNQDYPGEPVVVGGGLVWIGDKLNSVGLGFLASLFGGWLSAVGSILNEAGLGFIPIFFVWLLAHLEEILLYLLPEYFEPFITYALTINPTVFVWFVVLVAAFFIARKFFRGRTQRACEQAREDLLRRYFP